MGVHNERNLSSASLAERLRSLASHRQEGGSARAAAQLPADFQKPEADPAHGLRVLPPSREHLSTATFRCSGLLPAPDATSGFQISKRGGDGSDTEGRQRNWQAPGGSCPAAVHPSSAHLIARLQVMRKAAQLSHAPVGSTTAPAPIPAQEATPAIAVRPPTGGGSGESRTSGWGAEGSAAGRFCHSAAAGGQQRVLSCNPSSGGALHRNLHGVPHPCTPPVDPAKLDSYPLRGATPAASHVAAAAATSESATIPSTEHSVAQSPVVPARRMPPFGAALLAGDDPDGVIRGDLTAVRQPAIVEASADVSDVEGMVRRSDPTGANGGGKLAEIEDLVLSASASVSDYQSIPEAAPLAPAAVSHGSEDACLEAVKSVFDGIRAIFDPDIEQADADR